MAEDEASYVALQPQQPPLAQVDDGKRNLIVNYLPATMSPQVFKNLFETYGTIESSRIMTDKITGAGMGYGFVKFITEESAAKAITGMNGRTLENKTLKVSYARPSGASADPNSPVGAQQANVYVACLDHSITKEILEQVFSPFGPLIECKILHDVQTGESRGCGFVRFESRAHAAAAILALNQSKIQQGDVTSQPIFVKFADTVQEKKQKQMSKYAATGTFPNLHGSTRYNPMARPGQPPVPTYPAMPDYNVGYPGLPEYAYGTYSAGVTAGAGPYSTYFVDPYTMAPPNTTSTSTLTPQPMPPGMTPVTPPLTPGVGVPNPGAAITPVQGTFACLFVYHLPADADDGLLYRLFGPFGAIANVKVVRDPATQQCKGFGFVNFLKYEEAQQAVIHMNGTQLGDRFLQVSFKSQKK